MSIRIFTALALLSGLTAFTPAPEAIPASDSHQIAMSDEDERCIWVSPTKLVCP